MSGHKAMGGHQSAAAKTTTWLTPPAIIAGLGGAESFDLDPCAFPGWVTARAGYVLEPRVCRDHGAPDCAICSWSDRGRTSDDVWKRQGLEVADGLAADWFGRVWLNPPYTSDQIADWLRKLADHGRGTSLIFARTETDAFQGQVFERASGLLWLAGRLHFHHADGTRAKANAGAPSVLVAYGQEDLDRLAASDLAGHLTPLRFPRFVVVSALDDAPASWREIVMGELAKRPGAVSLSDLYRAVARHPKAAEAKHWRAKVRQTLQRAGAERVGPSTWSTPHG